MSDFYYLLSGGSTNHVPENSIGGERSNYPVFDSLNNLFGTVEGQSVNYVDYRCFYFYNDGTETLEEAVGYISETTHDPEIEVGVGTIRTEVQRLSFDLPVSAGDIVLSYGSDQFLVEYNADPDAMASDFQAAIRSITCLDGVTVASQSSAEEYVFSIVFDGNAKNKSHPLLVLEENNLAETPGISIARTTAGGPINTTATQLAVSTVSPFGITFNSVLQENPIEFGSFCPGDYVPIWIKRTTLASSAFLSGIGFTFRIRGKLVKYER